MDSCLTATVLENAVLLLNLRGTDSEGSAGVSDEAGALFYVRTGTSGGRRCVLSYLPPNSDNHGIALFRAEQGADLDDGGAGGQDFGDLRGDLAVGGLY